MGKKKADKKPAVAVKAKAKAKEPEIEIEIEEPDVEVEVDIEDMGPADEQVSYSEGASATGLVPLLHRLIDTVNTKTAIPAVEEICSCGAALTISERVPEADRKRMYNAFLRRHKPCLAGVSTDED